MEGHMIAFRAAMTRKGEMEKRKTARDGEPQHAQGTKRVSASR
jgi:hypothetical protein